MFGNAATARVWYFKGLISCLYGREGSDRLYTNKWRSAVPTTSNGCETDRA